MEYSTCRSISVAVLLSPRAQHLLQLDQLSPRIREEAQALADALAALIMLGRKMGLGSGVGAER